MTGAGGTERPGWAEAERVARLFAADPPGTGVWLRARPGPQRERWLQRLAALMPDAPIRKLPLAIGDDRLLGGLDLTATLAAGRPVAERGLLAEADGGAVLIPSAERAPASLAARLAAVHDHGEIRLEREGLAQRLPARFGLILIDEGLDETERPPAALLERIAFRLDLTGLRLADLPPVAVRERGANGLHSAADAQSSASRMEAFPRDPLARPSSASAPCSGRRQALSREGSGQTGPAVRLSRFEPAGQPPSLAGEGGAAEVRGQTSLRGKGAGPRSNEADDAAQRGAAAGPATAAAQASRIAVSEDAVAALCAAGAALQIGSARAPLLALRTARIAAALDGRSAVAESDLALAGQLVLAWRASALPEAEPNGEPPEEREAENPPDATAETEPSQSGTLADRVMAATRMALPRDLLERLQAERALGLRTGASGAGAQQKALRRGRRIGTMPGQPRGGARLDLVATIRAAVPWQRLRQRAAPPPSGNARPAARIAIRPGDFRVQRLAERRETLIIFVVDASGSLALSRMAEAKGAVELLLADCYVRRDQVALIAFRGKRAELLLPPSRSLPRAKRSLAALPAGGGTPLALGIDVGADLARSAQRRGQTPLIVLLTDGRANIARDGEPRRASAQADALAAAALIRAAGLKSLLIDTAAQPEPRAGALADAMGALYLAMPQASAGSLSAAVRSARGPGASRHG